MGNPLFLWLVIQEGQGVHHAGGGPEWPMPPIRFGGATSGSPGGLAGHQIQSLRVPWSKSSKSLSKSLEIPVDICGLSMFGDTHHVKHHGSLDDPWYYPWFIHFFFPLKFG